MVIGIIPMEMKLSVTDVENILTIAIDNKVSYKWSDEAIKAIGALKASGVVDHFNGSKIVFGTSPLAKKGEDLFHAMI